jgi:hypothetical protein
MTRQTDNEHLDISFIYHWYSFLTSRLADVHQIIGEGAANLDLEFDWHELTEGRRFEVLERQPAAPRRSHLAEPFRRCSEKGEMSRSSEIYAKLERVCLVQ